MVWHFIPHIVSWCHWEKILILNSIIKTDKKLTQSRNIILECTLVSKFNKNIRMLTLYMEFDLQKSVLAVLQNQRY
jgi:hypothetical protein